MALPLDTNITDDTEAVPDAHSGHHVEERTEINALGVRATALEGRADDLELVAAGLGTASTHPATDFATPSSVSSAITTHAGGADPHGDRSYADTLVANEAAARAADIAAQIAALVGGAPGLLDTLGEIATQIAADESAAAALATTVAGKQAASATLTLLSALSTTSIGRSLLTADDQAALRSILQLGGAALLNVGTAAGTVAAGDDSRLSNARTPTAHAASHAAAGPDALTLAQSQVTGLVADLAAKLTQSTADGRYDPLGAATLAGRFGGLLISGHSYTRLGGSGSYGDRHTAFPFLFAAAMGIPESEVTILGKSGGQLTSPSIGDTDNQGAGLFFRHVHPPHAFAAANYTAPSSSSQSRGQLAFLMYGINDPVRDWTVAGTLGINAYRQALRATISKLLIAREYLYDDSTIAYGGSGSWSTVATNQASGGSVKRNGTNGATVTVTLPPTVRAGDVIALFLHGNANGSGLNYSNSANTRVDLSGTAGAVTATPASGNVVAGSPPRVYIAGQGTGGTRIQMVIRLTAQAGDAGKTIVLSLAGAAPALA